jgi:hypothetical protein
MKKLLLTLIALPLAASATGAFAQANVNAGGAVGIQNRIANLEARYDAGVRAGAFTTTQRNSLSRKLTELRNLERSYAYNGLTQAERQTLQQRIRVLRDELRVAGGSNWSRNYGWNDADMDTYAGANGNGVTYDRYGRPIANSGVVYDQYGRAVANNDVVYDRNGRVVSDNRVVYDRNGRVVADNRVVYDRNGRPIADNGAVYDQYGRPVANNNVVYDRNGRPITTNGVVYDRYGRPVANNEVEYDRYGRPVSGGYQGQGGPYESANRNGGAGSAVGNVLGSVLGGGGGMGGILGSIIGRGGLRTGDLVTGAIGSVLGSATRFGPEYRDNSNVYYRSDGERVYEVDARNNTVIRVLPVQR